MGSQGYGDQCYGFINLVRYPNAAIHRLGRRMPEDCKLVAEVLGTCDETIPSLNFYNDNCKEKRTKS